MWWVVDDWVEGESLDQLMARDQLNDDQKPAILRDIAVGIQAIHAAGIIRRELAPRHVLIRTTDGSAVLTDFELAKLTDGAPTVAPRDGWPDDDYRALEVDSHTALDARADIYSWGRIAVHVLCGKLPSRGAESEALGAKHLPAAVRKIVLAAVALPRSDRPTAMSEVIAPLRKWS